MSPDRPTGPRLLIHALGGGLGHLQRSLALARALSERGAEAVILHSGLLAPDALAERVADFATLITLPSPVALGGREAWRAHLRTQLIALSEPGVFAALVIDTFAEGLLGELGPGSPPEAQLWPAKRILVRRARRTPEVPEALRRCALILEPGEAPAAPAPEGVPVVRTAPWLIAGPDELLPRRSARRVLGLDADPGLPLIGVIGSGTGAEIEDLAAAAEGLRAALSERAEVLLLDPRTPEAAARWPLLGLLPAFDLVIGAGGYNTVYECRATRTPLLALARRRKHDDQAARLGPRERVRSLAELPARVALELTRLGSRAERRPAFRHGAGDAAEAVLRMVEG